MTIGFLELLTVLFVGLKLTQVITWSWLWVLAPIWLPYAFALAFLVLVFGIIGVLMLFEG